MEIGEYSTNVLSSNHFSSVHYIYYSSTEAGQVEPDALIQTERIWRQEGSIAIRDPEQEGLYVFGSEDTINRCAVTRQAVDNDNIEATYTEQGRGSYTPSILFRDLKSQSDTDLNNHSNAKAKETQIDNALSTQNVNVQPSDPDEHDLNEHDHRAHADKSNLSSRTCHELFLTAVVETLILRLCENDGYLPLNARTLLIQKPATESLNGSRFDIDGELTIVTIDVQMTAQTTLVLKTSLQKTSGMGCLMAGSNLSTKSLEIPIPYGSYIYLAPIDRIGQLLHVDLDNSDTKGENWKNICISWFHTKGIRHDISKNWTWLSIRLIPTTKTNKVRDNDSVISWPASLCFYHKDASSMKHNESAPFNNYDVLGSAEHWHNAQTERDVLILERRKDRELAEASISEASPQVHSHHQSLRRSSVAANIYPTPPDGVQLITAVTPMFDAEVGMHSTPQIAPASTEDPASSPSSTDHAQSDYGHWVDPGSVQEPDVPPTEAHDQRRQASDNLFGDIDGDIDGDLFGDEHDVTDADFSFFDAPDTTNEVSIEVTTPSHVDIEQPNSYVLDNSPEQSRTASSTHVAEEDLTLKIIDTEPEIDIFTNQIVAPPSRPRTPPLNPETVFKRLSVLALDNKKLNKLNTSVYEGIVFNPALPSFASKYGDYGRFVSPTTPRPSAHTSHNGLPETDYMNKRQKRESVTSGAVTPATIKTTSPYPYARARRASTSSDVDSDDSIIDTIPAVRDLLEGAQTDSNLASPSRKRRRSTSQEMRGEISEVMVDARRSEANSVLDRKETVLNMDPAGWSLAKYFRQSRHSERVLPYEDIDYVAIAQTLVEQSTSSIFEMRGLSFYGAEGSNSYEEEIEELRVVQENVSEQAKSLFMHINRCDFSAYVDISDGGNMGQQRLPIRPVQNTRMGVAIEAVKSIFMINAPYIEVSRADSNLAVLPAAIPFWRNLGLGPSRGVKDVSAICIFPEEDGLLLDHVHSFLGHVGSAYESGRFGVHDKYDLDCWTYNMTRANSLDPSSMHASTTNSAFPSLQEINIKLGLALTSTTLQHKNFVIYYVYDSVNPLVITHICSAFRNLREMYRASFIKSQRDIANDLVLQLVPLNFVASKNALVMPALDLYAKLAMEVYDRCGDLKSGSSAPAISVERPPFRMIDFNLSPQPSTSVLQENSVMHIAYASSIDLRWVTAAWSDSYGTSQFTASYCRRRYGRPLQSLSDLSVVAAEMWNTTIDVISSRKVKWRVMIAKCGVLEAEELDMWKRLIVQTGGLSVSVTILCTDTRPSLQLIPPATCIAPSALMATSLATPVSTPQAGVLSPDQTMNSASTPVDTSGPVQTPTATPSADANEQPLGPDSSLVDVREQSWGAILSHRLNNANTPLEINPSLISGYLVKRGGPATSDPPTSMEVNILYSDTHSRLHEVLLREVLSIYRGLGTLSRVRGRSGHYDVRPWHILVAERGVEVLECLL